MINRSTPPKRIHYDARSTSFVNFDEVAAFTVERSQHEILRHGGDEARMQRMFAALEAITELPPVRVATTTPHGPFLTVHLRRNGVEARIFSAVATIGTPIDATAEEITIETFFPADDATARLFHSAPPGAS